MRQTPALPLPAGVFALDATPLTVPAGGTRRYVQELLSALATEFPGARFLPLTDQDGRSRNWLRRRWWLAGVQLEMKQLGVHLFHGADFSVPYLPFRPSVMTLLDLSPWRFPDASPRVRTRTPLLLGLGLATMVVTLTEAVRREAIEAFRLSPARVTAVPLAASPSFRPVETTPAARPYFLYVGSTESRKNLPMLRNAWQALRQRHDVDLRITGEAPPVSDRELSALYSGAAACLYPSLYEGFGLPILEAMQCGTPVIASRTPAAAEVAGGAALLLDPNDTRAWRDAMEAALLGHLREACRERGLARARQFSWAATARQTFAVYQEALGRFHA
ncbi:MAG TPA: hypothetical protein DEH78_04900 [Solibacterales bacterium]|nr:hypothetical protein [Bryobacterales bacterium]